MQVDIYIAPDVNALLRFLGGFARGGRAILFCEDRLTLEAERAVAAGGAVFGVTVTSFARFLGEKEGKKVLSKQGSVMVVGAIVIMWLGEIITQRGVGNGMSLIIFANIMSGIPTALITSVTGVGNIVLTVVTLVVIVAVIPLIVYVERGQRRIPIQYAKRVVGRRMMGGQSTYLPIKVNTAGVVPIIFASAILYLPAQLAVFFPNVDWVQAFANALSAGWINWVLSVVLIVAFAYFYSSMVFNPTETADQLRKQGGFIPGVRPGAATAAYIKSTIDHITLPGALFMAVLAVVPTIIFSFTGNSLIQAFGGTSVLIMVSVAMDTLSSIESQLKMHNYDGFFK